MEVIQVTGTRYPDAHELPNKRGRPVSKHQKSPGGNSARKGAKHAYLPRLTGRAATEAQNADRKVTEANRMVMWLHDGKRRFVRASDYDRLRKTLTAAGR